MLKQFVSMRRSAPTIFGGICEGLETLSDVLGGCRCNSGLDIDFASLTREYKVHFVAKIQELHRNTMVHRASDVEDALMSGSFFPSPVSFFRTWGACWLGVDEDRPCYDGAVFACLRSGAGHTRWADSAVSVKLNPSSILCCTNGPHSKFEDF